MRRINRQQVDKLLKQLQILKTIFNRFSSKSVFYQKMPLLKRTPDLRRELNKPAPKLKRLFSKDGNESIKNINEVLSVRYRELDPITYANDKEVYLFEPGRGVQLYVFGMIPEMRLPMESNFGAMIVHNGTPINDRYFLRVWKVSFIWMTISVFFFQRILWSEGEVR